VHRAHIGGGFLHFKIEFCDKIVTIKKSQEAEMVGRGSLLVAGYQRSPMVRIIRRFNYTETCAETED
jgi:hypothetical protein